MTLRPFRNYLVTLILVPLRPTCIQAKKTFPRLLRSGHNTVIASDTDWWLKLMYTFVVSRLECPINFWTLKTSTPESTRWVAKLCRKLWAEYPFPHSILFYPNRSSYIRGLQYPDKLLHFHCCYVLGYIPRYILDTKSKNSLQ